MAGNKKINIDCFHCMSRKSSIMGALKDEELSCMSEHKTSVNYKKGQTLFYEGTRPMGLFCINDGKVKVFKMGSQGKEQIIRLSKPGELLGYRALLGEEFYAASATVLEDASICFIPKFEFFEVLNKNPTFYKNIVQSICHELGVLEERFSDIAQKSVRERLAANLLMLKASYGLEGEDSVLIDIALSREDLANIVGTATETVIRLLSEFKKDGLIAFEGKKIRVHDAKSLAKEADFYA